jgi:hypothetical protein
MFMKKFQEFTMSEYSVVFSGDYLHRFLMMEASLVSETEILIPYSHAWSP